MKIECLQLHNSKDVLKQPNFYDCGVHVLFNLRMIIEDKKFAINNKIFLELIGGFREMIKYEMIEKNLMDI